MNDVSSVSLKARERVRRRRESTGSITLADVAKLAGVSSITVSRAIHRPEIVRAETIARVRDVVLRTGYVPNLVAGGLASSRTKLVAALVPSITNGIFVETIQALTDRLWEAGYQVLLGLSGYPSSREDALISAILSRRPDAVCLTGINHSLECRSRLLGAKIPIVETWDMTPTPMDMLVGFSHELVGEAVARHLLSKGHRRFGLIWADDARALARQRGFLEEVRQHGCGDVRVVTIPAPSTLTLGRRGFASLMDSDAPPTAVFCSSDMIAHGALEEARARRLSVPLDIALMGFGDLEFAPDTCPALSTVRIDRAGIGARAADLVLARLEDRAILESVVDVGFEIIDRGTT